MGNPQPESPVVDVENAEKVDRRRIISMEDPFRAFQVISQHADLDFVSKLGKLLTNVADVMKN